MSESIVIVAKAISAAICMCVGSVAPALGESKAVCQALEGMARQPEAADNLRTSMILGCAVTETTGIYCLVISLLILFAL